MKINGLLPHATMWINLMNKVLSVKNQTKENTRCVILCGYSSRTGEINLLF